METSFISLIKSCLNGQEIKFRSISYSWSRMSMSFTSLSCSNIVKTPICNFRFPAVRTWSHTQLPRKKIKMHHLFSDKFWKTTILKSYFLIWHFSFWVPYILNLLIMVILESDLASVAVLLFNLPFFQFSVILHWVLRIRNKCSPLQSDWFDYSINFYSISCKQCEIQCYIWLIWRFNCFVKLFQHKCLCYSEFRLKLVIYKIIT